ncbi:transcriptional regulator [Corynebacterium sp. CNJ-954]|uniref:helix-turn-helix transcriptional regulator n=1 Tax=Corynebacterium sp. CNJ-954 TaxID=1904962 RepID=UPI0009F83B55|nr:PAS domain-containing protein [Corynebacterium sp. CNJ-954]
MAGHGELEKTIQQLLDSASRRSVDGERLVAVLSSLVEPIGKSLSSSTEVVLHDLSLLPNSIVSIHGDVTGRKPGGPSTDLLLQKITESSSDQLIGYETYLPDGRKLRSSTMIIRDLAKTPVAAFCINTDVTAWEVVANMASSILGKETDDRKSRNETNNSEKFVRTVDELSDHILRQAIDEAGLPVPKMQKHHKLAVVATLKARGMFLLRNAADTVAGALNVSRFTIYNYLNEIEKDPPDIPPERPE